MEINQEIDFLYSKIQDELKATEIYLNLSKKYFDHALSLEIDNITEHSVPEGFNKYHIEMSTVDQFNYKVLKLFSQSFVLIQFRVLEKNINEVCSHIKKERSLKLSRRELHGSVLETTRKYLETFGGFKFEEDTYNKIDELYTLRSFLVHGGDFDFETGDDFRMNPRGKKERILKKLSDRSCGIVDLFGSLQIEIEFCDYCLDSIKAFFELLHREHKKNFKIRML